MEGWGSINGERVYVVLAGICVFVCLRSTCVLHLEDGKVGKAIVKELSWFTSDDKKTLKGMIRSTSIVSVTNAPGTSAIAVETVKKVQTIVVEDLLQEWMDALSKI